MNQLEIDLVMCVLLHHTTSLIIKPPRKV